MTTTRGVYEKVPGSGIWWIRYADSRGNIRREKVGGQSDATTLVAKRRTEALLKNKLPEKFRAKAVTFSDLCADALERSTAANSSKSVYELNLKIADLKEKFGGMKAEDITKQDIVRWLEAEAKKRGWKASSRNRWQAAISLIFRVGIDNEKITTNPATGITRKTENNAAVRFLTVDEEQKLRAAITDPLQLAALEISIYTGMRQSEQFGLRWSQVDLEKGLVFLPKTKNGKPRHVPLNAVAVAAFKRIGASSGASTDSGSPVFPGRAGETAQGARGWFKNAVTRSGILDYTWHCNRHTFASRLVMLGEDIRTVGELLGHRSLQMTLRYSHLAPEHTASAVNRLLTPALAPAV
jgi:site-specific recombinase XerD